VIGYWRDLSEELAVRRRDAAEKHSRHSIVDTLFAGGSTVLFMVMMATVAGAITLYIR
jgi:hypothetical protein